MSFYTLLLPSQTQKHDPIETPHVPVITAQQKYLVTSRFLTSSNGLLSLQPNQRPRSIRSVDITLPDSHFGKTLPAPNLSSRVLVSQRSKEGTRLSTEPHVDSASNASISFFPLDFALVSNFWVSNWAVRIARVMFSFHFCLKVFGNYSYIHL